MQSDPPYAISRTVEAPFDKVEQRIRDALGGEGFGVLTEIDVRSTLKKKLDVDIPRYSILGACIPRLAHQAILCEADVGLLLPCNILVREIDQHSTVVAALDPVRQLQLAGNASLEPLAAEIRARLDRAITRAAGDQDTRKPAGRTGPAVVGEPPTAVPPLPDSDGGGESLP